MSAGDLMVRTWRGRSMGGRARVVVVGGTPAVLAAALDRLEELECRWSRFRADSEVWQLAVVGGRPTLVSPDTALLIDRMVRGWRATGGLFDPSVGASMIAAGYDRTFEDLGLGPVVAGETEPAPGMGAVRVDRTTGLVQVPAGLLLDPGAIGKGLAADVVVEELLATGAAGALVDLGGDVRVAGRGPRGGAWHLAIADVVDPEGPPLVEVALTDGAIATSGVTRRRWSTTRGEMHHVIDPSSGRSTPGATLAASVVAGSAWWAEVLATAALVAGGHAGSALLESHRAEGVVRGSGGESWWAGSRARAA